MPAAPIAKGPYYSYYNPHVPYHKTNPTATKSGVIIMCAVLIAAGYTVYENREQVMELVDKTRRKISLAMHQFADEIMPSEQSQRQPMAFNGRSDGTGATNSLRPSRANSRTRSRRNSADSITLRGDDEKGEGTSRDNYMADSGVRYRPQHRGFDSTGETSSAHKNPFDDDNRVLFDASAESTTLPPPPQRIIRRRSSSETLSARTYSEKDTPLAEAVPVLIPAVLPVVALDTVIPPAYEEPAPPLPPRPSAAPVAPVDPPAVAPISVPVPEHEPEALSASANTFSTSQPYWAIQQWTEDVTGSAELPEHSLLHSNADEEEEEDDEQYRDEAGEHSAVQSIHTESVAGTLSVIGSEDVQSEDSGVDDRVEIVSDIASSLDGWSEVGSQFSDGDRA